MQSVKKTSIIMIILFFFVIVCFANPVQKRSIETYDVSYYLKFLDNVLVPAIQYYIEGNMLSTYNEHTGKKLIDGVIKIIQSHVESYNIIIPPGQQYPVSLVATPNNDIVVYSINVVFPFVVYDKKGGVNSMLGISINFFCGKESVSNKERT